ESSLGQRDGMWGNRSTCGGASDKVGGGGDGGSRQRSWYVGPARLTGQQDRRQRQALPRQTPAQKLPAVLQPPLERCQRQAHLLSGLIAGGALEIAQQQRRAVFLGQVLQFLINRRGQLVPGVRGFG